MFTKIILAQLALLLTVCALSAQTPAPVVVQAAAPPAAATPVVQISAPSNASALKVVQDLKAKNTELLQKQEATLLQLDEIQKAVEQLKIYSKRG